MAQGDRQEQLKLRYHTVACFDFVHRIPLAAPVLVLNKKQLEYYLAQLQNFTSIFDSGKNLQANSQ